MGYRFCCQEDLHSALKNIIETVKFLEAAKAYGTENGDQDQATTDLFLSNKLAFVVTGPWMNPTFKAAKASNGLDYDYVLIPGATADNKGGVKRNRIHRFCTQW